ncbi:hypothetical protein Ciccas_009069 [Cichlidogyrus casuarinus]|uniref:Titin n=1 Tax=Cichlidogyrus casuarinus TaxID=1844966 RepID=A0ABD2Q0V2_9PLAT
MTPKIIDFKPLDFTLSPVEMVAVEPNIMVDSVAAVKSAPPAEVQYSNIRTQTSPSMSNRLTNTEEVRLKMYETGCQITDNKFTRDCMTQIEHRHKSKSSSTDVKPLKTGSSYFEMETETAFMEVSKPRMTNARVQCTPDPVIDIAIEQLPVVRSIPNVEVTCIDAICQISPNLRSTSINTSLSGHEVQARSRVTKKDLGSQILIRKPTTETMTQISVLQRSQSCDPMKSQISDATSSFVVANTVRPARGQSFDVMTQIQIMQKDQLSMTTSQLMGQPVQSRNIDQFNREVQVRLEPAKAELMSQVGPLYAEKATMAEYMAPAIIEMDVPMPVQKAAPTAQAVENRDVMTQIQVLQRHQQSEIAIVVDQINRGIQVCIEPAKSNLMTQQGPDYAEEIQQTGRVMGFDIMTQVGLMKNDSSTNTRVFERQMVDAISHISLERTKIRTDDFGTNTAEVIAYHCSTQVGPILKNSSDGMSLGNRDLMALRKVHTNNTSAQTVYVSPRLNTMSSQTEYVAQSFIEIEQEQVQKSGPPRGSPDPEPPVVYTSARQVDDIFDVYIQVDIDEEPVKTSSVLSQTAEQLKRVLIDSSSFTEPPVMLGKKLQVPLEETTSKTIETHSQYTIYTQGKKFQVTEPMKEKDVNDVMLQCGIITFESGIQTEERAEPQAIIMAEPVSVQRSAPVIDKFEISTETTVLETRNRKLQVEFQMPHQAPFLVDASSEAFRTDYETKRLQVDLREQEPKPIVIDSSSFNESLQRKETRGKKLQVHIDKTVDDREVMTQVGAITKENETQFTEIVKAKLDIFDCYTQVDVVESSQKLILMETEQTVQQSAPGRITVDKSCETIRIENINRKLQVELEEPKATLVHSDSQITTETKGKKVQVEIAPKKEESDVMTQVSQMTSNIAIGTVEKKKELVDSSSEMHKIKTASKQLQVDLIKEVVKLASVDSFTQDATETKGKKLQVELLEKKSDVMTQVSQMTQEISVGTLETRVKVVESSSELEAVKLTTVDSFTQDATETKGKKLQVSMIPKSEDREVMTQVGAITRENETQLTETVKAKLDTFDCYTQVDIVESSQKLILMETEQTVQQSAPGKITVDKSCETIVIENINRKLQVELEEPKTTLVHSDSQITTETKGKKVQVEIAPKKEESDVMTQVSQLTSDIAIGTAEKKKQLIDSSSEMHKIKTASKELQVDLIKEVVKLTTVDSFTQDATETKGKKLQVSMIPKSEDREVMTQVGAITRENETQLTETVKAKLDTFDCYTQADAVESSQKLILMETEQTVQQSAPGKITVDKSCETIVIENINRKLQVELEEPKATLVHSDSQITTETKGKKVQVEIAPKKEESDVMTQVSQLTSEISIGTVEKKKELIDSSSQMQVDLGPQMKTVAKVESSSQVGRKTLLIDAFSENIATSAVLTKKVQSDLQTKRGVGEVMTQVGPLLNENATQSEQAPQEFLLVESAHTVQKTAVQETEMMDLSVEMTPKLRDFGLQFESNKEIQAKHKKLQVSISQLRSNTLDVITQVGSLTSTKEIQTVSMEPLDHDVMTQIDVVIRESAVNVAQTETFDCFTQVGMVEETHILVEATHEVQQAAASRVCTSDFGTQSIIIETRAKMLQYGPICGNLETQTTEFLIEEDSKKRDMSCHGKKLQVNITPELSDTTTQTKSEEGSLVDSFSELEQRRAEKTIKEDGLVRHRSEASVQISTMVNEQVSQTEFEVKSTSKKMQVNIMPEYVDGNSSYRARDSSIKLQTMHTQTDIREVEIPPILVTEKETAVFAGAPATNVDVSINISQDVPEYFDAYAQTNMDSYSQMGSQHPTPFEYSVSTQFCPSLSTAKQQTSFSEREAMPLQRIRLEDHSVQTSEFTDIIEVGATVKIAEVKTLAKKVQVSTTVTMDSASHLEATPNTRQRELQVRPMQLFVLKGSKSSSIT